LSADDKKDKDKVKAFDDAKKAFGRLYGAIQDGAARREAGDNVGHNRVAINLCGRS